MVYPLPQCLGGLDEVRLFQVGLVIVIMQHTDPVIAMYTPALEVEEPHDSSSQRRHINVRHDISPMQKSDHEQVQQNSEIRHYISTC